MRSKEGRGLRGGASSVIGEAAAAKLLLPGSAWVRRLVMENQEGFVEEVASH